MTGTSTRLSSVVRLEVDCRIVFTVCMSLQCLGTPILKLVFLTTRAVISFFLFFLATVQYNLTYQHDELFHSPCPHGMDLEGKQLLALDYSGKQSRLSSNCIWILAQSFKNTGVRSSTSTLPPDVNLSTWFATGKWNREGLCNVSNRFLVICHFFVLTPFISLGPCPQ